MFAAGRGEVGMSVGLSHLGPVGGDVVGLALVAGQRAAGRLQPRSLE